jgi:hypothetical protein
MNDLGIIENHKRTGRNVMTDISVNILADRAIIIHQQLRHITLCEWVLGYPILRQ